MLSPNVIKVPLVTFLKVLEPNPKTLANIVGCVEMVLPKFNLLNLFYIFFFETRSPYELWLSWNAL